MRLLNNDDVIAVRWTSGAGANWTVSALLAQATSRGFTSFFTYYLYDNYPHILFFNPIKSKSYVMDIILILTITLLILHKYKVKMNCQKL